MNPPRGLLGGFSDSEDFAGERVVAVAALLLLGLGGSFGPARWGLVLRLSFPQTVTSLLFSAPLLRQPTRHGPCSPGACSSNSPALRLPLRVLRPLSLVHTLCCPSADLLTSHLPPSALSLCVCALKKKKSFN